MIWMLLRYWDMNTLFVQSSFIKPHRLSQQNVSITGYVNDDCEAVIIPEMISTFDIMQLAMIIVHFSWITRLSVRPHSSVSFPEQSGIIIFHSRRKDAAK
jgi:hypothetical protein